MAKTPVLELPRIDALWFMPHRARLTAAFRLALDVIPSGMLLISPSGEIVLANPRVEEIFGYTRHELLGQPLELLLPSTVRDRHIALRDDYIAAPSVRSMGTGRDLFGLRKDGTEVPVEIALTPVTLAEGEFILSSIVDITARKRRELEIQELVSQLQTLNASLEERVAARTAQLSATLRERETLLREIHHRVKNNLQVISSMINMQARQIDDPGSRAALADCQTRVQAIALVHDQLYRSHDYSRVRFSEFIPSLARNVLQAMGAADTIALVLDIDDVAIDVATAVPCGLLLNELLTNALKHAFPDRRLGTIRVELRNLGDGQLLLAVSDDGVGVPAGFESNRTNRLGMQLVATLVAQLDGHLRIVSENGARFEVTFGQTADLVSY